MAGPRALVRCYAAVLLAQPRFAEGGPRIECEFNAWFGFPSRLEESSPLEYRLFPFV